MKWLAVLVIGLGLGGFLLIKDPPKVETPPPKNTIYTPSPKITVEGLHQKVNAERLARGLGALALNESLNKSANAKCLDMQVKNYWAHASPDGTEPWHFFDTYGIEYLKAGENLAYAQETNEQIVSEWMASPTHRDNILYPYEYVGYGICDFRNEKLIVQHFYK